MLVRFKPDGAEVTPHSVEDLWYLTRVVKAGDVVKAHSERRFKASGSDKDSGEKKHVKLELRIEQVEFAESANKLRLTGVILHGEPIEFISLGSHHTIDVEPREKFFLAKEFTALDKALLKEAVDAGKSVKALIVVMDERKATIAAIQAIGLKFLYEIHNSASKRDLKAFDEGQQKFFAEVMTGIEEAEKAIIAGPGFSVEDFKKILTTKKPALARKCFFDHASNAEKTGVYELLKRGVVEKAFGEMRLAKEFSLLEEFKKHISREDGLACYGLEDVGKALEYGAVSTLMVTDEIVRTTAGAARLFEEARKKGAELVVFDVNDEAGQELKTFGVAALLRFKTY